MQRFAPLVLLLTLALAPEALAGPKVPELGPQDLPVAGTCAPIPSENVTWLTLGERGWYRLDRDPQDRTAEEVRSALLARSKAAVEAGRPHDVWIVVAARRAWAQVVETLQLCEQTGVFRVGLAVRAESGETGMGFPLFLPPPRRDAAPTPAATARLLSVRLVRPGPSPLKQPVASHPSRLYAAAKRAVELFGPVVASVGIRWDVPIQDAVRAIDLLYRAGCAGVRLPYLVMAHPKAAPVVEIWVEDQFLEAEPLTVAIPEIRPRKRPWDDHGAAREGVWAWRLEPVPTKESEEATSTPEPLPSYAARGTEVPPEAMADADGAVRGWADRLGGALGVVLRPGRTSFPAPLLVQRRRREGLGVDEFFADARTAFPRAEEVTVGTVRVQAYLFRQQDIVGQIDLTAQTSGARLGVVFARWVGSTGPRDLVLPPAETDPFAGGVPGQLRVWVEGVLAAASARGPAAVPLAAEDDVLGQLPAVAHAGVRRALDDRLPAINALIGWLRARPYDRVVVVQTEGSAAVRGAGRVLGILRFGLESEQGELSLSSLQTRVAR